MELLEAVALAATALLAFLLTGLQIRLNRVLSLTAAPKEDRWHRTPTPSSGGIAVFLAAGLVYCICFRGQHAEIALAAAAMWALGLVDDLVRLPPMMKFAGQALVAASAVASGLVFHATSVMAFNLVFSFVWLVGITNAFNLIDNMDGLCAGVVVIVSLFRFALLKSQGFGVDAGLWVIVGSAYAGFLAWNYRPARIFMGDCGSMFAGFTLAALTIAGPLPRVKAFLPAISSLVLMFIYPIFDTALVLVLRTLAGRAVTVGGRDHSSHRLVAAGFSEPRAVGILWVLAVLGAGIALMVEAMPLGAAVTGALLLTALVVFGWFLARCNDGERLSGTPPSSLTPSYGSTRPAEDFVMILRARDGGPVP